MMTLTPEAVLGGMALLGGVIIMLNRLGLLSFGRKNSLNGCPDAECQQDVRITKMKVEAMEETQEHMKIKIDKIAEGVSFIKGKLSG